jgi:hypothetical protein
MITQEIDFSLLTEVQYEGVNLTEIVIDGVIVWTPSMYT